MRLPGLLAAALLALSVSTTAYTAELPATFPDDVPIAAYMVVTNVMQVRDDLSVDLQAPGKDLAEVVEWFRSGLADAGWSSEGGESVTAKQAILAYKKDGRRCGVIVTDFVMSPSMQMDNSTKGITLQISNPDAPTGGGAVSSQTADAEEVQ